jgi:hypothetical protein
MQDFRATNADFANKKSRHIGRVFALYKGAGFTTGAFQ